MADALTVEDVIIYADTFVNKLNESAKQQIRTRKTDYIELLNSISKEAEATVKFMNGEIPIDELIQSQVKGLNEREGSTEEQAGQMVDYWSGQLGIEITENKALEQISQQEQVNIPAEGENAANAEETPAEPTKEQQLEVLKAEMPKDRNGELDYEKASTVQNLRYVELTQGEDMARKEAETEINLLNSQIEKIDAKIATSPLGGRIKLNEQKTGIQEQMKSIEDMYPVEKIEATYKEPYQPLREAKELYKDSEVAMSVLEDMTPASIDEVVATLLGTNGNFLLYNDVSEKQKGLKSHTGFGHTEMRNLLPLFRKKENGGITADRFGENVEQYCREMGISYDEGANTEIGRAHV